MDLKELRQQIDEIDTKIIALYEQRMEIVKQVSIYKIANNIPVLDAWNNIPHVNYLDRRDQIHTGNSRSSSFCFEPYLFR